MFKNRVVNSIIMFPIYTCFFVVNYFNNLKIKRYKIKIIKNLNLENIDKFDLEQLINIAKIIFKLIGYNEVELFSGCSLQWSNNTIMVSRNDINYLIKIINDEETFCYNKLSEDVFVGVKNYSCNKVLLFSNCKININLLSDKNNVDVICFDRERVDTLFFECNNIKRYKKKVKVFEQIIFDNII